MCTIVMVLIFSTVSYNLKEVAESCVVKTPQEIHFICLIKKDVSCILKTCCIISL